MAVVEQIIASDGGRNHVIRLNVKFRNVTNQPIILAYHSGSSVAVDNYGSRYFWGRAGTHDTSATGIGLLAGRTADPQFTLNPGETRTATWQLFRPRPPTSPIGSGYTWDVTIDQLEVLPGVIRSIREYALNFPDLAARAGAMAAPQGAAGKGSGNIVQDIMKSIPKKK